MFRNRRFLRILLAVVATHGLLLLNDGIYWDSWLPTFAAYKHDLELAVGTFRNVGVTALGYFLYACAILPGAIFVQKVMTFFSILAIAWFFYRLCSRSGDLSDGESELAAVASVLYSADRAHAATILTPYPVATALWFWAVWLCFEKDQPTWSKKIASYALFISAFLLYSPLLAFHLGFLGIWALMRWNGFAGVAQFFKKRMDLVLLPFVVYGINHVFFPPHPRFAGVYAVNLDLEEFRFHGLRYWVWGLKVPFEESIEAAGWGLLAGLLALGVALPRLPRFRFWISGWARTPAQGGRSALKILGVAVLLFLFGTLPFILVGKSSRDIIWWERQNWLLGWSVALAVVGVLRAWRATWSGRRGAKLAFCAGMAGLIWLGCGHWIRHQKSYLMLQSRWISYRSIVENLKLAPEAAAATFFHTDERAFNREALYMYHTSYTWTLMFTYLGWAHEDKAVVGAFPFEFYCKHGNRPFEWEQFGLTQLDIRGKHIGLILHHGPEAPYGSRPLSRVQLKLIGKYFWYRFLDPEGMTPFLTRVTRLEFQPVKDQPTCPKS